jgi:hypothetical protein
MITMFCNLGINHVLCGRLRHLDKNVIEPIVALVQYAFHRRMLRRAGNFCSCRIIVYARVRVEKASLKSITDHRNSCLLSHLGIHKLSSTHGLLS